MGVTLITHWFNEELLAPFFVQHYAPLVDRAIIIDYGSTDRGPAIVREMAPNWELRPTRESAFDSVALDVEVMDLEREVSKDDPSGWKIVVNVTEFLLTHDLRALCARHEVAGHVAFAVQSIVGVDLAEERPKALDPTLPLWRQIQHGYLDNPPSVRRWRFFHRADCGLYHLGRHGSSLPAGAEPDALLLYVGFSHTDVLKPRKLQIQHKMSESDKLWQRGFEHIVDDAAIEEQWRDHLTRAYPLEDILPYQQYMNAVAA